jgi:hypothetical protein
MQLERPSNCITVLDSNRLLNSGEISAFSLCIGGKSAVCWKGDRPVLVCINAGDAL